MDFLAALRERTLVLDGAMGSELMARGFGTRECPELWNVTNPDVVADIHRGYFAAGSDVVHTNTFGGSRPKLAAYHCQERTQELNEAGARLAVAVRDEAAPGRFVAGDVGSTGRLLKPMGDMDPRELEEVFVEQIEALARGGVDLVSIETMFDLEEARLAVKAAREVSRLPVSAAMTFNRTPKGYRTMMGVTPQQAVETLLSEGADVVGCNCTLTADDMIELVGDLRRATDGAAARRAQRRATASAERPHRLRGDGRALRRGSGRDRRPGRRPDRGLLRHERDLHRHARAALGRRHRRSGRACPGPLDVHSAVGFCVRAARLSLGQRAEVRRGQRGADGVEDQPHRVQRRQLPGRRRAGSPRPRPCRPARPRRATARSSALAS